MNATVPTERRYGVNAIRPDGISEDPTRCAEAVWNKDDFATRQCTRKRGHGPNGDYCVQHATMHHKEAERRRKWPRNHAV